MVANIEIERKFLIKTQPDGVAERQLNIRQGYIAREGANTVRIRQQDEKYILSIKTARKEGGRNELEYEISSDEGQVLFASLSHPAIVKTRHIYDIDGLIWEVDIFSGANQGLIIAEVELTSIDQKIALPDWIGPEVTDLSKFYNANLAYAPFENWRINYADLISRLAD